jgi:hypothetical protein
MALFELYTEYKDGTATTEIIVGPVKIYPKRDGIIFANSKRFKYHIKTDTTVGVVSTPNGKFIVGGGKGWIPCHPETQLTDIFIIKDKPKKIKEQKDKEEIFTFNSKSSDSIYKVRVVLGKPKCDCVGQYRAKDRKCVHMKEVEKILKERK